MLRICDKTDPKANFEPAVHIWGEQADLARFRDFLRGLSLTGVPRTLNDIAECRANDGMILIVPIADQPSNLEADVSCGAWKWQIAPGDLLKVS